MKKQKIGKLNYGRFKTSIFASEELRKKIKSLKISEATLIPVAWTWYNHELLELLDEDGDGKIDEKFGKEFEVVYFNERETLKEYEKNSLSMQRTSIKNLNLKYVILKCQQ